MFISGFEKNAGIMGLFKSVAKSVPVAKTTISDMRLANKALPKPAALSDLAKQTRATTKASDMGNISTIAQRRLQNFPHI